MTAMFALVLSLSFIHISIDQDGGLSAAQVAVAVDQMQQIWRSAGVTVTASGPGEARRPGQALVSCVSFNLRRRRMLEANRPSHGSPWTRLTGAWLGPFQVAAEQRPMVLTEIAALARSQHAF